MSQLDVKVGEKIKKKEKKWEYKKYIHTSETKTGSLCFTLPDPSLEFPYYVSVFPQRTKWRHKWRHLMFVIELVQAFVHFMHLFQADHLMRRKSYCQYKPCTFIFFIYFPVFIFATDRKFMCSKERVHKFILFITLL